MTLVIKGDQATFEVNQLGLSKPATDVYSVKVVDKQIIMYKPKKHDSQLVFDIVKDGKQLKYEPNGKLDLPSIWYKKPKG